MAWCRILTSATCSTSAAADLGEADSASDGGSEDREAHPVKGRLPGPEVGGQSSSTLQIDWPQDFRTGIDRHRPRIPSMSPTV
jgi:hypothetical protein